ncbi:hypothetical protein Tco_1050865, partial [Tanacetum coccineum]
MQETNNRNQEAAIQLMQNQMGQMAEAFQERPLGVLPRNTKMNPLAELNVINSMDSLTWDGSFIPHFNFLIYQDEEQEPETIMEVVEIASSQSTPLPLIPYPSRLKKENFQALENPTGHADHFVYRIDIVDSLCDKFPIENNSLSGNPTSFSDYVIESLSPSLISYRDSDSLVEETDTLLSHFNDSSPDYETFCFDTKEKSSGKKSSGNTTSHSDLSLLEYDSFHFDLSIDPLPLADRSDSHHEEFADELAHVITLPEYDCFYFDIEPDPGELAILFEENISEDSTKEFTSPELNDFPL